LKVKKTLQTVVTILSVLVFIIQPTMVKASGGTGKIDFLEFPLHDRPIAIKLWQSYGQDCIGKWIVISENKDGTKEEVKLSYGPGAFSKMTNGKIVNITCIYARVSRRTYIPLIDDYIYD